MATLGFSEAAALAGVSRQQLYKLKDAGKITVVRDLIPGRTGDSEKDFRNVIDVSELRRVFPNLGRRGIGEGDQIPSRDGSPDLGYRDLEVELQAVKQSLHDRENQLQEAKEREEWLRRKIDAIQDTVKLLAPPIAVKNENENVVPLADYNALVTKAKERIAQLKNQNGELRRRANKGFFSRIFNLNEK